MIYGIAKQTLDSPGLIEISEEEFRLIESSQENLFEVLYLEEKLDLVTENYYEYEVELLSLGCRLMIFRDDDYFSMSDDRNLLCRRVSNLLSACRMYIDQSKHHIKNIYGDKSTFYKQIIDLQGAQYDQRLGYRVMEELRNYVQHRGIPIHNVMFTRQMIEGDPSSHVLFQIVPKLQISVLKNDEKFKRRIIEELSSQNKDIVDLRPYIRDYIEGIVFVHERLREILQPDILLWEKTIDDVIEKFTLHFEATSIIGLAIVTIDEDGKWIRTKPIFKDFIDKRRSFEKKNRVFINLNKRFASNIIRDID